jgi:hypothetical protein
VQNPKTSALFVNRQLSEQAIIQAKNGQSHRRGGDIPKQKSNVENFEGSWMI